MAGTVSPRLLTVPGLCCSGPDHWQSLWEATRPDCARIELPDWDDPDPEAWIAALDRSIGLATTPVVLAAHSLGCHAVVRWAAARPENLSRVAGALLVAPPDVDAIDTDPRVASFAPTPRAPLPFSAMLIASRDDPYASFGRLRAMADIWSAEFVDVGCLGHINADSGIGLWPDGQRHAGRLLAGGIAGLEGGEAKLCRHILQPG